MIIKILKELYLALRNVFRNTRRSGISASILMISVISICFFGGYLESIYYYYGNTVIAKHGHFQIFKMGYLSGDKDSLRFGITPKEKEKLSSILSKYNVINVISQRLNTSGLIGNEYSSTIFVGLGLIPEKEIEIMNILPTKGGDFSVLDDNSSILIGKILAQKMNYKVGQGVTLMSMSESGSLEAVYATIRGTISTGVKSLDSMLVLGSLPLMKELYLTKKIHSIVVLLNEENYKKDQIIADNIKDDLKKQQIPFELKMWYEIDDTYQSVINIYNTMFKIITLIFVILIGFTVTNV